MTVRKKDKKSMLVTLVSLLAMADMGLIELTLNPFGVRRSAVKKANPGESALWQRVQRWRG